ncbi:MAG: hypothetical protein ACI9WU_000145 [Myxococcota bacterium]|jgi:hypothetical protein
MLTRQGNLLLFDNGDGRAIPPLLKMPVDDCFSRVVEYRIHEPSLTVEQVWSYGRDRPDLYSPIVGDADELPLTGNVLSVFGATSTPGAPDGPPALRGRILELRRTEPAGVALDIQIGNEDGASPDWTVVYRAAHVSGLGD